MNPSPSVAECHLPIARQTFGPTNEPEKKPIPVIESRQGLTEEQPSRILDCGLTENNPGLPKNERRLHGCLSFVGRGFSRDNKVA